jgi:hypothetical protein
MTFKKGDYVRVNKGKFKGWYGAIAWREPKKEYTVFAAYRKTRQGYIRASDVGLGLIAFIPHNRLTKKKTIWGLKI